MSKLMKRALIFGASGGIGGAIADNLSKRHWDVTSLSRSFNQFDVTDEDSVKAAFPSCQFFPGLNSINPQGPFDFL